MKLITFCDRIIEYSLYALFFLVPLIFSGDTSELFELNKMWLTFGLTAIVGATWATKMVLQKRITIQRTPLDIVFLLFLISQIISSIFSLDPQVSWWGYYSRFNGGLLSTICYYLLYYAFVSNLQIKQVWKTLIVSLFSGLGVSLWGFPSHFGYDPTCLVFRGTFDTSCWTYEFVPTIRAFSTLGQPEWLAAYMAFLTPLAMAYALKNKAKKGTSIAFFSLSVLFYLLLIFSDTRAGFLAFWIADIFFWAAIFFKKLYSREYFLKVCIIINILFLLSSFIFGSPVGSLSKYTLPELAKAPAPASSQAPAQAQAAQNGTTAVSALDDDSITDSGVIRLLVWQGAIRAWENNPLIGTGVETFAFAYYKYKLPAHNMTSEWDYLYNKAHNEFLNYLATTGIFGLGTYLGFIGIFLFVVCKDLLKSKAGHNIAAQKAHQESSSAQNEYTKLWVVNVALLAGFGSILITNFFGFSIVIINLYTFLVPAFMFILLGLLRENQQLLFPKNASAETSDYVNPYQWTAIIIFICVAGWMIISLIWYRQADIAYALGSNLDKVGQYQQAYPQLLQAVQMEPDEAVYKDELSINMAALAADLYSQKSSEANQVARTAISLSDDVVTHHPNNVVYWKDRVRVFYTLSAEDQADEATDLQNAIQAINTAKSLAPTDAKIAYNQAVLYGQAGAYTQAIQMLNSTIQLKPNYEDAFVALGLFYHDAAIDQNGKVIKPDLQQKAIDTYNYILKNLDPNNAQVKKSLEQWSVQ
jgi:putative inorganic carbon (hco3(-)) transporter